MLDFKKIGIVRSLRKKGKSIRKEREEEMEAVVDVVKNIEFKNKIKGRNKVSKRVKKK